MNVSHFPVGTQAPRVVIRAHGDLLVQGIDDNRVTFEVSDKSSLSVQQNNDDLRATVLDDCRVSVPRAALVEIERAGGDLEVQRLSGRTVLHQVGGDCELEDLGELEVINVGGDLTLRQSAGPVNIHHVGGDLEVDEARQALRIDGVGGDAILQHVALPGHIAAGGDVELTAVGPASGPAHIHAGGDVELTFPGGANLALAINTRGDIEVITIEKRERIESRHARLELGSGGPELVVNAGGDVTIRDRSGEPARILQRGHGAGWTGGMEAGIRAAERSARINQQAAERGIRHAEEVSRRAQARVQEAMQRLDMRPGGQDFIVPDEAMPVVDASGMETIGETEGTSGQASDEERLLILQMVAEKKITIEEAEQLLAALEM